MTEDMLRARIAELEERLRILNEGPVASELGARRAKIEFARWLKERINTLEGMGTSDDVIYRLIRGAIFLIAGVAVEDLDG